MLVNIYLVNEQLRAQDKAGSCKFKPSLNLENITTAQIASGFGKTSQWHVTHILLHDSFL